MCFVSVRFIFAFVSYRSVSHCLNSLHFVSVRFDFLHSFRFYLVGFFRFALFGFVSVCCVVLFAFVVCMRFVSVRFIFAFVSYRSVSHWLGSFVSHCLVSFQYSP